MKYVISFSGGLCSFWAAKRAVEQHGRKNVLMLFADTLIEDPDLYRFNDDAQKHLNVPLVVLRHGMTPWQLFRAEGLIGNNQHRICSVKLKREMLDAYLSANFEMDTRQQNAFKEHAAIVMGFDWNEEHRLSAMRSAHPGWKIEAPMTEPPYWDKCRMMAETEALGIAIPRLYKMGFPHNNCGGACVAAGISHWVHLLKTLPEIYATWERDEQETKADFARRGIDSSFTILKDRRGGTARPLSLRQLRERVAAGEQFDRFDWGGCGCGAEFTAAREEEVGR